MTIGKLGSGFISQACAEEGEHVSFPLISLDTPTHIVTLAPKRLIRLLYISSALVIALIGLTIHVP